MRKFAHVDAVQQQDQRVAGRVVRSDRTANFVVGSKRIEASTGAFWPIETFGLVELSGFIEYR